MTLGLLAAGEGSRLRAEGITTPKGMVEVGGVPMIQRTIDQFSNAGIDHVCCIVNEESPDLLSYLQSASLPVSLDLLVRSTPSSLHSLVALSPLLEKCEGHFFLSTVDSVFPPEELLPFVSTATRRSGRDQGTIAVTRFVEDESPLYVDVRQEDHRIVAVGEDAIGREWVTGGLYYFPAEALPVARELTAAGVHRLRRFQGELVRRNFDIRAHEISVVVDVDHRADIDRAEAVISQRQQPGSIDG
jgi:NDP-sugar pyrophosphorylase family protein